MKKHCKNKWNRVSETTEEVNGGKVIDNISYDDSVFRVRIDVTDSLTGVLHAAIVIFDETDMPQAGIIFENDYQDPDTPDNPDTPDDPDTPSRLDAPPTGDDFNAGTWIALIIIAAIGVLTVIVHRKRKTQ